MQELIRQAIEGIGVDPSGAVAPWLRVIGIFVFGFVIGTLAAVFAGVTSWWERRVAGRIQSRIGPNRNGPFGFFQWIADAVKLFLKEGLIPAEADRKLFRAAPYLVFIGFFLTFVALPFAPSFVAADLNVGIYYLIAVTSLVVVGILMSGWSSNSKWSILGGVRSAAQVISYEIPSGIAVLIPVLMAGTLSTQGLIHAQGGAADAPWYMSGGVPWNWGVFANPMMFVAFFIFLISALAEGNRTPFDLPEAESELVSGYFTEYSGARFAVFFLTEWGTLYVMGALCTVLFLGGWQIPFVKPAEIIATTGFARLGLELLGMAIFVGKCMAMTNLAIWIRWTLPRIRVDQMMALCWKYLVPIALVLLVVTAASEWIFAGVDPHVLGWVHLAFFVAVGLVPAFFFIKRMFQNISFVGERVDLSNW